MKKILKDYIKDRFEVQSSWYASKSRLNKSLHYASTSAIIISAAMITVAAFLDYKVITIVLSALLAMLSGITRLFKFEDKWKKYRIFREILKSEKYQYEHKLNKYSKSRDSDKTFVSETENIIAKERDEWLLIITSGNGEKRSENNVYSS